MRKISFLFILCLGFTTIAQAQRPFDDEIENFRKADSLSFPPGNATLFVGSSSFRLWNDLKQSFPKQVVLNRGFGGSSMEDVIRYADNIIFPYDLKQIVIYCGENDIASGTPAQTVLNRFERLFTMIRKKMPEVPVIYVSMKPSPSRKHLMAEMKKGNDLIRDYLRESTYTSYVDVFTPMLDKDGNPRKELFVSDNLHMNKKGYEIWRKAILPRLK